MIYDRAYWDEYAKSNESRYSGEFATFVRDLATALRCQNVLEIGCGTGIDLRLLAGHARILGADMNRTALKMARQSIPEGEFSVCNITHMPYGDSSVDLVFTHQLLNYLDDSTLESGMAELYRVARKYVMSCEMHGEDGLTIAGPYRYRDIGSRWATYEGRIISNVDMHPDIEQDQARFILMRI